MSITASTSDPIHIEVEGWPELQKTLQAMMIAMPKQVMAGLSVNASRIVRDAKKACPVKTGNLRSSIGKTVDHKALEIIVSAGAELGGKHEVNYAAAVEYGTSEPFEIVPKTAKALSWIDKATKLRVFAKSVMHPARPPRPYFVPACNANVMKAQQDVFDVMKKAADSGKPDLIPGTGGDD